MFNDDGFLTSPYIVRDQNSLDDLSSRLHDEHFNLEDVVHDRSNGTVMIHVLRCCHNGPRRRRPDAGVLSDVYEVALMRTEVVVRRVRELVIKDDQEIGHYMICDLMLVDGLLILETCEALRLQFTVEALDIEVRDMGFRGTIEIKIGPLGLWESWGKISEDKNLSDE
ncbi:hypothetical protein KQH82_02565 [bacterium]|nr:hypothetical protein [bacterium]